MVSPGALAQSLRSAPTPVARRALLREGARRPATVQELLKESHALRRREPAAAEQVARCALVIARGSRDAASAAQAALALGRAAVVLGRPRHALRRLQQAVALDPGLDSDSARERAECLALLGRPEEGLHTVRSAREALPRRETLRRALFAFSEATILCWRLDRSEEALALWDRCQRPFSRGQKPLLLAALHVNRANALANLQRYARADRLYRRAAAIARTAGDTALALQTEYNRAYLQFLRGRFHEALRTLHDLRPKFIERGDERHAALCDLDEAEILLRLNLHAQAAARADRAVGSFERLGMRSETARALFFSAVAAREQGRTAEAGTALHEALAAFRKEGSEAWAAICLRHLAEMDRTRGDTGEAALRAAESARTLARLGFVEHAGRAEVLLARLEIEGHEPHAALERMQALGERIRGTHCPGLQVERHHQMSRACTALGRARPAAGHALRAVRILETHRLGVPPDEYMAGFLRDKASLYDEAIACVLRLGGRRATAVALEVAERARSRALLDLLQARPGAAKPEDRFEREMAQLEREIDGLLGHMPRDGEARRATEAARCRREAQVRQRRLDLCLHRLAAEDPGAGRRTRGAPATVDEIQRRMPPSEVLVEYFLRKDELLAFVVTKHRLAVARRALRPDLLRDLLARMRFQLDRPLMARPDGARVVGHAAERSAHAILAELDEVLLAPVRGLLPPGRVVVVPHGALHHVPFHALEHDGRAFLEDRPVSFAPSATIYLRCLEQGTVGQGSPLVLGYADAAAPMIDEEAQRVARMLPGARLVLGRHATRGALQRHARDASVVHLAAHGEHREEDPFLSGLRLADGWLTAGGVRKLRLSPSVLVLAGCATGRSWVTEGDELFGLARAFLGAGAKSLVTSLWRVADESTVRFMTAFHRALAEEGCAAAAVRRAALEVRAERPHPYHWAAFVHIGRAGLGVPAEPRPARRSARISPE